MTDLRNSLVSAQLAKRVRSAQKMPEPLQFENCQHPVGLHQHLREHLASGETHYTARPGLTELRQAIGRELAGLGSPDRDADGVIVTQGEGEALYVTLLGLGIGTDSVVAVAGDSNHRGLLDLLGIEVVGTDDPGSHIAGACLYSLGERLGDIRAAVPDGRFEIVTMGGLLFSGRSRETDLGSLSTNAVLIGHLNSLSGLDHFRMGFVAGPPDIVKRIQTWKQALSICSAAPSQRAAMFAISQGGVS